MPKYYAVDPINEGLGALVVANNAREAKENFISGHVVPYYQPRANKFARLTTLQ